MKKIVLLFVLSLIVSFANAQTQLVQIKPVGSKIWKYANIKGEIVINCEYPESYPFSEDGIAAVSPKKNLYLFINAKGEEMKTEIQNFYLKSILGFGAKGFSDGMVAVMVAKKWGYLNTDGKVAVPLKYDNLSEFHSGAGIGKIEGSFFIIDRTGKEIPITDKDITDIKEFSENLAPFTSINELKGYIGTDGKIAIPAQFRSVGYFSDGIAWAKSKDDLFGYINTKGEWIVKPQFTSAKEFDKESGLARVKKGDAWVYVNTKGETVSFNISDITDDFFEGMAKGKKNLLLGFHNNKGEWVIEPQFEGVHDFRNGYAGAKSNGLWGLIDKKGNWVIKPAFAGIDDVILIR